MILLYHAKDEVREILQEMELPYQNIEDHMLKETLGYLFRLDGFSPSKETITYEFPFDIMIIHDVSDEVLQVMIQKLKDVHANIDRKAMLTQHNQYWTMYDLLKEIDTEHTFFQYYDNIMRLLKESESLQPDAYDTYAWKNYQDAFIHAYSSIQEKPEDVSILINAYENLLAAKTALQKKDGE